MKKIALLLTCLLIMAGAGLRGANTVYAAQNAQNVTISANVQLPNVTITPSTGENPQEVASTLQLLFLLTIIVMAPTILLMMTCFPRILISLHFVRSALGTQQMPPNQILISLAIFMTLFMMRGEISTINDTALQPYSRGEISQEQAIENAMAPLRNFMFSQVRQNDVDLFSNMSDVRYDIHDRDSVPNTVLIPAFMISEIKSAFIIGVLIYIPFIAIDMVVASILMAMGMMMLPPAMISLPFKILIFVLVDGWDLTLSQVFQSFFR